MIYFDSAATTLQKPSAVARASVPGGAGIWRPAGRRKRPMPAVSWRRSCLK